MVCKLCDLLNAVPALQKLANADISLKAAYKLNKMLDALQNEIAFFEAERNKILNKFADQAEDGEYRFHDSTQHEAEEKLEQLFNMEITPDIEAITMSIAEDVRLSVNDIQSLTPFIVFADDSA